MRTAALLLPALLAACAAVPRTGVGSDALAPPGPATEAGGVDPRIVGDRLLAEGEPALALDAYIRAVGRDGPSPELDLAMAGANIRLGRLGQAERQLRAVLQARPDDARAWNDLGVVLMERGEIGEAVETFRRAAAAAPDNVTIRENLDRAVEMFDAVRYPAAGNAATLTRRPDGTFGLIGRDS